MSVFRTSLMLAALVAGTVSAAGLQAHAKLVASNPAANATVAAPTRLQLRFDEQLVARGSAIEMFMTARPGAKLAGPLNIGVTARLAPDSKTLVVPLHKALATGTYLVAWHATTSDHERKNGTFRFTVR